MIKKMVDTLRLMMVFLMILREISNISLDWAKGFIISTCGIYRTGRGTGPLTQDLQHRSRPCS